MQKDKDISTPKDEPISAPSAASYRETGALETPYAIPSLHRPIPQISPHRAKTLGVVLLLLASLSCGFLGGYLGAGKGGDLNNNLTATQKQVVLSESQLINSIAKDVGPSVVSVNVISQRAGATSQDPYGLYSQLPTAQQQSAGTGIIISSDGLIITNRHVVPVGTTSVSVTLSDGTSLDNVKVIGRTNEGDSLDIAFLKVGDAKGKKLVSAQIGDSGKVQVGDKVVAIGNALGQFQNTVTSGIISGYGRTVQASGGGGTSSEDLQDLFQTDAAINEGNSGGPLVNASGEIIGINTAIAGGAQNIGFAIPINDVSGIIKTVLSTGKFQQPYLGVRYVPLTNDTASQLNLKVTRGAYILPPDQSGGRPSVIAGSPADMAGLKADDIIQAVNGVNIDDSHSLTSLLGQHQVGDTVKLKILRDGKSQEITVKLGAAPTGNN